MVLSSRVEVELVIFDLLEEFDGLLALSSELKQGADALCALVVFFWEVEAVIKALVGKGAKDAILVSAFFLQFGFCCVHFLGDGLKHLSQKVFLAPLALRVFAFTHYTAMHKEIWGKNGGTVTYNRKQLTQYIT